MFLRSLALAPRIGMNETYQPSINPLHYRTPEYGRDTYYHRGDRIFVAAETRKINVIVKEWTAQEVISSKNAQYTRKQTEITSSKKKHPQNIDIPPRTNLSTRIRRRSTGVVRVVESSDPRVLLTEAKKEMPVEDEEEDEEEEEDEDEDEEEEEDDGNEEGDSRCSRDIFKSSLRASNRSTGGAVRRREMMIAAATKKAVTASLGNTNEVMRKKRGAYCKKE